MSNMYGKDKFHDRQKAVLQKSAQKIENDSGWSQDNFLRGYAEEILPASGAELSFGELCAIGEQVEQVACEPGWCCNSWISVLPPYTQAEHQLLAGAWP